MSKAKTVFSSHDNLAHVWAQQTYPIGYASDCRMFFDGPTIYSYGTHFAIARFVERKGHKAVLFTTRSYSSSTGKHKSIARRALQGLGVPVFYVDDVLSLPTTASVKAFQATINEQVAKFGRSTPWHMDEPLKSTKELADDVNEMAEFFGIRARVTVPTIDPAVLAKVQARVDKKRERDVAKAKQRRLAAKARDLELRADYIAGGEHWMRNASYGLASTLTEDEHAAHDGAYAIIQADKVAAWRAGKPVSFEWNEASDTMLRIQGDNIQTSRGAVFPIAHARLAFPIVARCRETSTAWETNGHKVHLGEFKIDGIDANGTVRAGCHVVLWPEIERVARELGLIEG